MNCKCLGCGIELQSVDNNKLGYVKDSFSKYCERCFRIKHYNDYQRVEKTTEDFYNIIDLINKTDDLVVLVVDILSISETLANLVKRISNDILLVLSKRDMFSYKINDNKLLNNVNIESIDKIIISSNKNYNIDLLLEKIKKYKKSDRVYVVGLTNSGKSTLINKMIYNYTDLDISITTSILPSTTLDTMDIRIFEDLVLVDTPGIIDSGNICNYLDNKSLKKIFPKKEIKPITYQVKCKQYILIENFIKIECEENCDITLYFSNQLKVERIFKNIELPNLVKNEVSAFENSDIVINGIGFINTKKNVKLNIYTLENVDVFVRNQLI